MSVSVFYNLGNVWCIFGIYIFLCGLIFELYSVAWLGEVSNICDSFLFLIFAKLPHVLSLVYELLINALGNCFLKIYKFIIRLEDIFHRQICIHFSACYEKNKNLDWLTGHSTCTLQTNLGFSPSIMPQGIVIVHYPPVSEMTRKNLSILELDYLPIHHPYLLRLSLRHGQS